MSDFRFLRRPFLRGNTDSLVQGPPSLRSENRRDDATLAFSFAVPARLSVRVTIGGVATLRTVNLASNVINDVVTALNAPVTGLIDATASDEGGFLVITGHGTGDGAQLRVEPVVGLPADAAPSIGFALHPDPLATSDGGDRSYSPAGLNELNPAGTHYATGGEDVTAGVLNRAVDALAYNADYLAANLDRLIALPMVIDNIDPTAAPWAARVVLSGGDVAQVNLGGISAIDSGLSDRIYLGKGLSKLSTLRQISQYFAVVEEGTLAEMMVGPKTVRVAAVTRGQRVVAAPTFIDEVTPPAGPVPDVAAWVPMDGGNLLGVSFPKTGSVAISAVAYNTAIRSTGATFQADGVDVYDRVEVSGAGVDVPFNHDGTYQVESVYSDEMLLLRGAVPEDRGELNDAAGVLGNVEVFSNSEFATDVWLSFDPPIPAGKSFRLVVGGGYQLRTLPTDYLLKLAVSTSEEVDSLVQQVIQEMKGPLVDSTDDFTEAPFAHAIPGNPFVYSGPLDGTGKPLISMEFLHRRTTLQGAYDGQGLGGGGGFFVEVNWNAPEWNNRTPAVPSAHTEETQSGTGATILAGNIVYADGAKFTIDDVGRQILIVSKVSGALRLRAAFVIIDYLDMEHVVVEPGEWNPTVPSGGDYGYKVVSGRFDGFPAAMSTHVLQSDSYGRLGYVHEEDRVAGRAYGHHMLAVREATTHTDPAEPEELRHFVVEFSAVDAADGFVHVNFAPGGTSNIRALAGVAPSYSQSMIRLTDTENNDGWYLVTDIDGATQSLRLMNFDGSRPVFTPSAADGGRGHIYNQTQGFFLHRSGNDFSRVGHTFFEDAIELQDTVNGTITQMGVLGVDWRGNSHGFFAYINDSDFVAYKRGDAAVGSAAYLSSYMPANGLESWHSGAQEGDDLSPEGNNPATALERGGWAGAFLADTYSMDGSAQDPLMRGTALYLAQQGTDSALVAVGWQNGGVHSTPPSPDDLTFVDGKATAVIAREDQWSMMQSGAGEFLGALYQWDPRSFWSEGGNLHNMYGGIYTELPMGSRFSNSPIAVDATRYHTTAVDGTMKLARLGQPGQVLPPKHDSASFSVLLFPPDPTKSRSARSSGFLVWDGDASERKITEDPAAYIGQQMKLDAVDDQYDGVYTIINVYIPEGENPRYWVEVLKEGVTLPTDIGENKASILGSRWHFANVDLESFAMLGTRRIEAGKVAAFDLGAIAGVTSLSLDSTIPAARRDYANGAGIINANPGSWSLGLQLGTSRHPIANEAWHPLAEPLGDGGAATALTNFESGEWAFRVSGPVKYNIDTRFDESFDGETSGGIHIRWDVALDGGNPFNPEDLFAYVKTGQHTFKHHYSYKVTLRLKHLAAGPQATGQNKTIRVALVDGIGGNLISVEKSFTMTFDPEDEQAVQLTFNSAEMGFDLREDTADALESGSPVILRLALGDTLPPEAASSLDLYVFQAAVENMQRSAVAGHLVTTGATVASGFELHTEALDWKSYGPGNAGPYGGIGYGDMRAYGAVGTDDHGYADPPTVSWIRKDENEEFIDMMSPANYWFRGRNDAAFIFLGGKFAPPVSVGGGTLGHKTLDAGRRGGMVGHVVPLDPPHGSILSTLSVVTSIFPAINPIVMKTKDDGSHVPTWCVFRDVDCESDPGLQGTGIAREGFLIEVWRQSVLPTENLPQDPRGNTVAATEVVSWQAFGGGFGELIHQEVVDLEGVPLPAQPDPQSISTINSLHTDCSILTGGDFYNDDAFLLTKIDLTDPFGTPKNERLLQVDRRQYSYSLVIKCWGVGSITEYQFLDGIGVAGDYAFPGATRWGIPNHDSGSSPNWSDFTRFRFRGATLGCRYTRMNP